MTTLADFDGHEDLMAGIAAADPGRLLVAVAGPPGAGKSCFAESLTQALNSAVTNSAAVIPMDGFHYDDAVLETALWVAQPAAGHIELRYFCKHPQPARTPRTRLDGRSAAQ